MHKSARLPLKAVMRLSTLTRAQVEIRLTLSVKRGKQFRKTSATSLPGWTNRTCATKKVSKLSPRCSSTLPILIKNWRPQKITLKQISRQWFLKTKGSRRNYLAGKDTITMSWMPRPTSAIKSLARWNYWRSKLDSTKATRTWASRNEKCWACSHYSPRRSRKTRKRTRN